MSDHDTDRLAQWFTPPLLAERIVAEWGPWDGLRVLEPAAGAGALVVPLVAAGAHVTAVEVDPRWAGDIRQHVAMSVPGARPSAVAVREGVDYLAAPPPTTLYHRAVMNPPYEGGRDLAFIEKALAESLEVVALLRLAFLAGKTRYQHLWSRAHLADLRILSRRPRFSGTSTTARYDFAVMRIVRGAPRGATDVQFWGDVWHDDGGES